MNKPLFLNPVRNGPEVLAGIVFAGFLPGGCMTTDARKGPSILEPRVEHRTVEVFERVTVDFHLDPAYNNPFDADEIRVDARIRSPSGSNWMAPGFWFQPITGKLVEGKPYIEKAGSPHWQVRLSFWEAGEHTVTLCARDRTGATSAAPFTIVVKRADVPGMIRRTPEDHRYFVTDRGETFFPVGMNLCWGERDWGRGVFAYDHWVARLTEQGCNAFRVFLNSEFTDCALHTPHSGYDRIDLRRAWNFDHVLELAESHEMRVLPVFDSFVSLSRDKEYWGFFEESVYARANGGPLDEPEDFFTNRRMKKAFRNRLRYAVARWGYSPGVFAWELWNEVDGSEDYDSRTVAAWHREMASYLRRIDPWHHLITTSLTRPKGDPAVDALPEMDFVMSHSYNLPDVAEAFGRHRVQRRAARTRPHFHGEFGASNRGNQEKTDPRGIHVHNALFSAPGQQQAGAPFSWWWDVYVDRLDLYPIWGAFNRWISGFDFVAQHPRPVAAETLYVNKNARRGPEDMAIVPSERAWVPAPFNRPARIHVSRSGVVSGDLPLSALQHGLGGHKRLHNPVTFEVDIPSTTFFALDVGVVSGYGGAHLQVTVDGKLALDEVLADREDPRDKTLLEKYRGQRRVPLAAGRHTIQVENVGPDWLEVQRYSIPRSVTPTRPPLRVFGLIGRTQGLVWVQNRHHTWLQTTRPDYEPYPVLGARLRLSNLPPGQWTVERWDTYTGRVVGAESRTVADDGLLLIDLPGIERDTAYRLHKQP